MSSSKTRNSKSSSTAATAVTATGVPQDAVATTSSASDPSGLRAPDGTISDNTPPSGGDAAGAASANLVKPQTNAENAETTTVEAANGTSTPETEASVSGTSSNASQGEGDGAGANAGSGQPAFDLAGILIETGTASIEHLIRVSAIGKNVLVILEEVATKQPRFQEWLGADDPADIIAALAEEVDVLQRTVDLLEDAADDIDLNHDRPFPSAVRVKAHRSGFRRAGLVLSADWESFAAGVLTVKQVDALDADPNIDVEPLT